VSGVPVSRSGTARIHIGAACRSAADSIGNKHSPPMQLLFQLLPLYELYGHIGLGMREIQLKDAKANLSAVVDQAARGGPSVITRHGKPEAVVLGFADWQRLSRVPSFGRLLMSAPLEPDDLPERDRTPLRDSAL
jgi:antitoxin Phd